MEIEKLKFTIEHYPLTNKFYPKYGTTYLGKRSKVGLIKRKSDFNQAVPFNTEDAAKEYIDIFKEQHFKNDMEVIEIK